MPITPSQRPTREWPLLVLALALVCTICFPLWQLFRSAYQMTRRPYAIGGAALLAGYASASVTKRQRCVSDELVKFSRSEQMARLKALFRYARTQDRGYAATASKPQSTIQP